MAKRSNLGPARDDRDTIDPRAVDYLIPFLGGVETFCEPCYGQGYLATQLEALGLKCVYSAEIKIGADALNLTAKELAGADVCISNPPWTREKLHPLILHLSSLKPTWLLMNAAWAFNESSYDCLRHCRLVVPTCRLQWIPGTTDSAKDDTAWFCFDKRVGDGPRIVPRLKMRPFVSMEMRHAEA